MTYCGYDGIARIKQLEEENEILRAALDSACEAVGEWGGYASDYFQDKWDLQGDCKPETHLKRARKLKK